MPHLSLPVIVAIGAAGALAIVLLVWGFHQYTAENQVADRTAVKPKEKKKDDNKHLLNGIADAVGRPFTGLALGTLTESRRTKIRARIDGAGRPGNLTVEGYAQRRGGELVLYGALTFLFFLQGITLFALLAIPFMFLTDLDLYMRAKERRDEMQRQLPDFLDVLAVVVGSGLGFRQALQRVADSMPGVAAEEFNIALQQMDLGTSRRDAFNALRSRNRNESLGKFVSALVQAEELGAPLSQALQEISVDMRRDDSQYMRRKAQKINPSVTAVTMSTIMPGLIILVGAGMFFGIDIDLTGLLGE